SVLTWASSRWITPRRYRGAWGRPCAAFGVRDRGRPSCEECLPCEHDESVGERRARAGRGSVLARGQGPRGTGHGGGGCRDGGEQARAAAERGQHLVLGLRLAQLVPSR